LWEQRIATGHVVVGPPSVKPIKAEPPSELSLNSLGERSC
jgi:hypothetical protein